MSMKPQAGKPMTERRWLRSVLAASTEPLPALPWARGQRRRPFALRDDVETQKTAVYHRPSGHFGAVAAH